MDEEEFVQALVAAGWEEEAARNEAYEQYRGESGDCDGDMAL